MKQSASPSWLVKKIASSSRKTKHPADFSHEWRGVLDKENDLQKQGCGYPSKVTRILQRESDKQNPCQKKFYLFVLRNLSLLNSSQVGFGFGNCAHSIFNFFRSHSKNALELIWKILQPETDKQKPRQPSCRLTGCSFLNHEKLIR